MDIKRRRFFERAGLGSAALLSLPILGGAAKSKSSGKEEHRHDKISGPLASATVSFGQWSADGLDRFPDQVAGPPPTGLPNEHTLVPTCLVDQGRRVGELHHCGVSPRAGVRGRQETKRCPDRCRPPDRCHQSSGTAADQRRGRPSLSRPRPEPAAFWRCRIASKSCTSPKRDCIW